jgi:hypothetical protein
MKIKCFTLALFVAGSISSNAATGFNNGRLYFVTSLNGGVNVYNQVRTGTTPGAGAETGHDLSPDGFNPQFLNFGTLTLSNTLVVRGFEYTTYENSGSDVTHGNLFYRVFPTAGGPTGAFTQISDSFNNDDTWTRTDGTVNILSGLPEGDYTIQLYTESYTNAVNSSGNIFGFTAGGGNPTATFSLIPEPSAALLGALGMICLLRRRRN